MTILWFCGQVKSVEKKQWEFQGIFDSEEKAIEACRAWSYFIAPVNLNESLPHETMSGEWLGYYQPLNVPEIATGKDMDLLATIPVFNQLEGETVDEYRARREQFIKENKS